MTLETWLLFSGAALVVILIPGPLSLLMISNSLNYGLRRSYPAFLGGVFASICLLSASALGLGALLLASESAATTHGLTPRARVVAMATAGVAPRIMGFGPAPAVRKVLAKAGLTLEQMDVIELNEAFAAQGLAVLRDLGLADDEARVNPNGGAIALGHPLGMSGARLVLSSALELHTRQLSNALVTMCVGVGQGVSLVIKAL